MQEPEERTTLNRILGPPGGPRDVEPPWASKMSVEDGHVEIHVKVYSKYRLLFEFSRSGIYECLFRKKELPYASRMIQEFARIMVDAAREQFSEALRKMFGWSQAPGRPRQKQLIFMLPAAPPADIAAPPADIAAPPGDNANKEPANKEAQI
jgi:hypothetical protein